MTAADIVILIVAVLCVAGAVAFAVWRKRRGKGGCSGCSGGGCSGCGRSADCDEKKNTERGGQGKDT